ncbi:MAG TPA: Omp28-related outer membrane protein [Chitinophagaceae bacterium]|nr:Omp28-related outer membrane protein [Chitinophagaceae bacterium]
MKKTGLLGIAIGMFFLQSCEEKGVLIDFGKKEFVDTTYTAAVETPQPRNVFIEEFTGASCVNCPEGHRTIAALIKDNPDRIVSTAYHTFNAGSVFKPVHKAEGSSKYDFRDSAATQISSAIYISVSAIPAAGVDRTPLNGTSTLLIGQAQWTNQTTNRLAVPSDANLYLTSSYDGDANLVKINVKIAYTKNISTKNVLTLGVTESKIIDAQEFSTYIDLNYEHNHVFRKCLTLPIGNAILDAYPTKEAGRVYEYNYSFTPSGAWNLENCYIIAALSNNESGNKSVLQAAEVKLK